MLVSGIGICVYSLFFAKKPLILSEKKYRNWFEHDITRRTTTTSTSWGRQEQQDTRRNIELAVQSEAAKRRQIQDVRRMHLSHFNTGISNKAFFSQTKLRSDFLSQAAHSTTKKIGRANTFSHFPVEPSAPTVQDLTE